MMRFQFKQAIDDFLKASGVARWAVMGLIVLYGAVFLAGPLSSYDAWESDLGSAYLPPTPVYWRDASSGALVWPYVFAYRKRFDAGSYQLVLERVGLEKYPLRLGVFRGAPYSLLGFKTNWRYLGVDAPAGVHWLGTDENGRDVLSRLLWGGQVSLTIGFVSLLVAFPIGLWAGGLAGMAGGLVDTLIMRGTEVLMSIPSLFILVSLASIMPPQLSSVQRFLLVSVLMALLGWTGLARVIRNLVLSIKEQEFVEAAKSVGVSKSLLLWKHILPQTTSYLIVAITLGVPGYLLAESALSFLGLGIQQPDASWGNMLKEAQELSNLIERPWLMAPAVLLFIVVLAYNTLGQALRDWLDPVKKP
jgi:peptide/nickel transport system permease protein